MFKNYFKIVLRNLHRHKAFSVINIPGLTIGIWLQNFTFRIKMNLGTFFTAILISVILAWIAVGYKSIKAAVANPVKSLRSE